MRDTWNLLKTTDFPAVSRAALEILQVNLGYLCNQSCLHCHVNAGPKRKELMQDDVDEGRLVQVSDIGLPYGRTVLLTAKLSEARPEVRKARAILKELLSTFGQTT